MIRNLSFVICSLASTTALASVNVFIGKVVSIATDNEETLVRIGDGEKSETFKVCSSFSNGEILHKAFTRGEIVKASVSGTFESCLSDVELQKDVQPAKADPAKQEKTHSVSKAEAPRQPSSIN